jgi:hypothetical protein
MFAFPPAAAVVTGSISGSLQQSLASRKVTLTTGGHTFSTFADAKGNFRFFGAPPGQGTLAFGGKTQPVSVGPGVAKVTLAHS